jgi:PAS domain S-box-containing protein
MTTTSSRTQRTDAAHGIADSPAEAAVPDALLERVAEQALELVRLQEASGRLRSIIDSAAEGFFLVLADGRVNAANESATHILGLSMKEILGMRLGQPLPLDLFWEDGRPVQSEEVLGYNTLLTGEPLDGVELSVRRPAGDQVWISINTRPLCRPGEHDPYAGVISFVDITSRKEAEIASAQRERRLALLHSISQDLTAGMSEDQIIQYTVRRVAREFPAFSTSYASVNPAALAQTAYTVVAEGLPELPLIKVDLARSGEGGAALRAGKVLAVDDSATDLRLASFDPDPPITGYRSLLKVPVCHLGKLVGYFAISGAEPYHWTEHQITMLTDVAGYLSVAIGRSRAECARRAVEENLRRSEERFRALVRNSSDILAVLDPAGRFTEITPAVERVLGYSPSELLGRTNFERIHPADRRRFSLRFLRCLKNPAERQTTEVRCLHKLGTWRWLEVIMNSLVDDPAVGGVILNARDITERREAADVLQRANEQLAALNQAKSDFVAIVSHEFRTPLTGIRGFSELIRDQILAPAEVKEYADDINADAQRLERMIDDMLDLERMQSGFETIEARAVDLNAVVAAVVHFTKPTTAIHEFVLSLADRLPMVAGDRDKLFQVVSNLVANAVKYSPQGGNIRISTVAEDGFAHLQVTDHGVGIPEAALARIFDRYARIESAGHRVIKGTGLGLPIARQLVELHKGRIWVDSTLGAGSTFHVLLPWFTDVSPRS